MTKNVNAKKMYQWIQDLFPICRSITGMGVRQTLNYIKKIIPDLLIHQVNSGTKAFDWEVPKEWNVKDAYIADEAGNRIIDFRKSNLHVMGYSIHVDKILTLDELQQYLYSLPEQPDAIPYMTSYYKERWGFCLTHQQRQNLKRGKYHVKIDSCLNEGYLNYADLVLPGETEKEVLLSTYVCHPSMANNELSGPAVTMALVQWLKSLTNRKYTYRIVFIPETIGSIVYLSRHLKHLRDNVIAGYVITCVGDNRSYSYIPSRLGSTLADKVAKHVLRHHSPDFITYSFLDRGSDERQYCSPGIDLPICLITRTKYGQYPEYHTSLDNLTLVSEEGLWGGYTALQKCIEVLENNETYQCKVLCEPQLGKRGLYPTISTKDSGNEVRTMMDLIAYADGQHDLLSIAEIIGHDMRDLVPIAKKMIDANLFELVSIKQ